MALMVAVWAALSSGADDPPASTGVTTTTVTTTSVPETTATTSAPTTSTTVTSVPDTTVNPEARVEEVRLILQDLWFGWFDAIYHNDEEAVREVVATEASIQNFRDAVPQLGADRPPQPDDIVVDGVEILMETPECLVVFSELDLSSWRGEEAVTSGVDVLWDFGDTWRKATRWTNRGDLWQNDCISDRSDELR